MNQSKELQKDQNFPQIVFPELDTFEEVFESWKPHQSKPGGPPSPKIAMNGIACFMEISSWCSISDRGKEHPHQPSILVQPTEKVIRFIAEKMVQIDGGVYFEIVIRDDDTALCIVKFQQIIGSRWLALIPNASKLPFFNNQTFHESTN